jgi:hypothetical protein
MIKLWSNRGPLILEVPVRTFIPVVVFVVTVATLSGCSAGAPPGSATGGGSSSSAPGAAAPAAPKAASGSTATSSDQCMIAAKVLAKFVTAPLSSPYQKGENCFFGVGPNGTKSGSVLAQQLVDSIIVKYTANDVNNDYQSAQLNYGGESNVGTLSGVGTKANYWGGLEGNSSPQVWARSGNAVCIVQTHIKAAEVGLTSASASADVAKSDVPNLAAKVGGICAALFGN